MYKTLKLLKEAEDEELVNQLTNPEEDVDEKEDKEDEEEIKQDQEETIDSEEDQDENPVDEDNNILDTQLNELRDILIDLDDLRLYKITGEDDEFYIIGKMSDNSDNVEMLVDTQPIDADEPSETKPSLTPEEIKVKYQFTTLPDKIELIKDMNPKYTEEGNPRHEELIEYLMNLLLEQNPEAAEDINNDEDVDIEEPENEDLPDESSEEIDQNIDDEEEDDE